MEGVVLGVFWGGLVSLGGRGPVRSFVGGNRLVLVERVLFGVFFERFG